MIVSITQFSKMTGKSRVAIYKAIEGERLFKTDDGKIDTDDPASMTFAASNSHNRGGQDLKRSINSEKKNTQKKDESILNDDGSLKSYSISDTTAKLNNVKLFLTCKKLETDLAIKIEEYVPRKTMQEKVLNPIDEFFIKMISDLPRSMLMSVKESLGAGMTDGEIERGLKSLLESHIKRAKADLRKGLR